MRWSCKWLLAGIVTVGAFVAGSSNADAHWWRRGHFFGWHTHYSYGWSHYRPIRYCYPRYYSVNYYVPRPVYHHTWYYTPAPVYYSPVIYTPFCENQTTYQQQSYQVDLPTQYSSSLASSQPVSREPVIRYASSSSDGYAKSTIKPVLLAKNNAGPIKSTPPTPRIDSPFDAAEMPSQFRYVSFQEDEVGTNVTREKVRIDLDSFNPDSMTDAANQILDDMVQLGELTVALESCRQTMNSVATPSAGAQLRFAILSLFGSAEPTSVDTILDRFNRACATGSRLVPQEFRSESLSDYLKTAGIDVGNTLNEFSKNAVRDDNASVSDLLVIATLLRLDGQKERSMVFANEAFSIAADKGDARWASLLTELQR